MAGTANGLSQQGKGDTSKASRTSIRRIFRSRASPRRLPCRTCRVSYGSLSPRPSSRQVGLLGSNHARNHKQTSKASCPPIGHTTLPLLAVGTLLWARFPPSIDGTRFLYGEVVGTSSMFGQASDFFQKSRRYPISRRLTVPPHSMPSSEERCTQCCYGLRLFFDLVRHVL